MNNPLDITEDDIERINEWQAEHSIHIPANESNSVAVGFRGPGIGGRQPDSYERPPHRRHHRVLVGNDLHLLDSGGSETVERPTGEGGQSGVEDVLAGADMRLVELHRTLQQMLNPDMDGKESA